MSEPATKPALTPAARLADALHALAHGLPNVFDESTDYFEGFHAPLNESAPLTPDSFQSALHIGAAYHVDFRPARDFFVSAQEWDEPEKSGFALLDKVMNALLTNCTVAFARKQGRGARAHVAIRQIGGRRSSRSENRSHRDVTRSWL